MSHAEDKYETQLWARKVLRSSQWVILDTDHTGFGDDDTIVGITVMAPDGRVLLTRKIPPRKTKGTSFKALLQELLQVVGGKEIVTYNAEFRERIFLQTCDAWGCNSEFFDFECVMLRFAAYVGEPGKNGEYKYQKLPKTGSGEAADCHSVLNLIKEISGAQLETSVSQNNVNAKQNSLSFKTDKPSKFALTPLRFLGIVIASLVFWIIGFFFRGN